MIISDASVQKNKQSGFAWIIAQNCTTLWHGAGLAPGSADDIYLGCAKAYGILAAIMFLTYYVQCYTETQPPMVIKCFCDNIGIVTTLCSLQTNQIP